MEGASLYILRCADEKLYTGLTRRDVDERVSEHMQGQGGLSLDRFGASTVLVVFIVACIVLIPQRAGHHPGPVKDSSRRGPIAPRSTPVP